MVTLTGARGLIGSAVARQVDCSPLLGDVRQVTAADLHGTTVLIHTAFKSIDTDGTGFDVNVEATRALIDAAQAAGVKRVIMTSSVGVYGHHPHVDADESTPLAPDTPVSRSRAACDAMLLDSDLDAIILRTRFVIGQGDKAVIPRIHHAVSRSPVWVDGGRARLSLVWVDDFARVVEQAVTATKPEHPVFHVTDGSPVSFKQLATEVCHELGGRLPRLSVPLACLYLPIRAWERIRGIDPETSSSSISSIRLTLAAQHQSFRSDRLTAWLPNLVFTPRAEALAQSAAWYRAQITAP